ncbi:MULTISPECIES: glycosyltransferase family 2 protein [Bacteroides]|uniref:glycosyltransferase family 2 protein n=1 Tax=Bacteroides TaxID=816 RepID=UPI0018A0EF0C|nr:MULTISPECIES: glycosyltransferase [Bacteroides]MDC1767452.1 glycosyltransferase [Bacteroides uniformis]MDC1771076.1 glycosyltransferase [Bacteroides uniformis]MDC1777313.1 glycosyltransferase [Bacteroides uniformis]MDC1778788.1 glycosyltransferase [Bacteroides uniformis]
MEEQSKTVNKMTKVSVVIPVYGVEKYIERCARSLFEQTLNEMEYIFINDCTPDASMQILRTVLEDYPHRKNQVLIINHPINQGAAKARENGMRTAKGEYVIHCDSDDWVERDMYRTMYNKAKANNSDIVICKYKEVCSQTERTCSQFLGSNPTSKIIASPVLCSLFNKLVRREIISSHNIHYPTHHMMEDAVLCSQIFYYAESIAYIDSSFYFYRINNESICHVSTEDSDLRRWKDSYENVKIIESFLKEQGVDKIYKKELMQSKANVKGFLMPQLQKSNKYYKLWHDTFSEINWRYPFTKEVNLTLRIVFFLTLIRIYPYFHRLIKK